MLCSDLYLLLGIFSSQAKWLFFLRKYSRCSAYALKVGGSPKITSKNKKLKKVKNNSKTRTKRTENTDTA